MSPATKTYTKRTVSWFKRFQYDEVRDSPSDARNVLLVIVALIAAVTFQAGVNPPGGVWQEKERAGIAVYASRKGAFYVFLISNTLALSSCMLVITSLTYRFPFHFEILVATVSMMITYASAIFAVTPHQTVRFRYLLIAASGPFLLRCLGHFVKIYYWGERKSQIKSREEGGEKNGFLSRETVRFRYLLIAASLPFLLRYMSFIYKKYYSSESQIESQEGGEKNWQAGDEQV